MSAATANGMGQGWGSGRAGESQKDRRDARSVLARAGRTASRVARVFALLVGLLWVLAALAVAAFSFGPRAIGYQALIVRSGSMEPAIRTGSVVLVQPVPASSLKVGDVITYERAGETVIVVTHRIVGILQGGPTPTFQTQGDASGAPDPYTVTYPGTGWKVIWTLPFAGYFFNSLAHPLARALLVGVPAAILSISFLADIWRGKR